MMIKLLFRSHRFHHGLLLPESEQISLGCISNCYFNLYTRLDVNRGDLLNNLGWAVEINDPLVDSHLELIPGLGTFSTRSLTGGDTQGLGWHAHRALTFSSLSLAPRIRSPQTFSRDLTFLEVKVILILWTGASSSTPFPSL